MSTATSDRGWLPPPPPSSAPSSDIQGAEAANAPPTPDRGVTVVTDQAAGRLAMAAASEVDGVVGVGSSGGLSGILPSSLSSDRPSSIDASAHVEGDDVALDLTVGLEYPRPVRTTLEQLARHVGERMQQYAGLRVERLDVTVAELRSPQAPRRARVQ